MGRSASLGYRVGRSSPTDRSRSVVAVTELVAATAPAVTQSSIAMLSTVLVSSGREPPLYLVERLWRGSVGAGCSPRRVGLYPPVT